MTTTNNSAGVAKRYRVAEYVYGEDLMPGEYIKAADYDALLNERDELLHDRDSWQCQATDRVKDWDDMRVLAEVAEAKAVKLVNAIKERFESYYRQGPDYETNGEAFIYAAFLEDLHEAALNEEKANGGRLIRFRGGSSKTYDPPLRQRWPVGIQGPQRGRRRRQWPRRGPRGESAVRIR